MSNSLARLIEKDILSAVAAAAAGESTVYSLNWADKYSCQFSYTVSTQTAKNIDSLSIFDENDLDHPSQFLSTANGFLLGQRVAATTDGDLPDPLTATNYYVVPIDADYFSLATSLNNALAGTIIDLVDSGNGTQTLTPQTISGASVKLQKSNSLVGPWIDVQTATAITTTGTVMIETANVSYRYVKAVKALSAGAVDVKANLLVIGFGD